MPDVTVLSNHLKKQGFHVVFSNTAKDTGDVEVGFCNIRKDPAETPGTAYIIVVYSQICLFLFFSIFRRIQFCFISTVFCIFVSPLLIY